MDIEWCAVQESKSICFRLGLSRQYQLKSTVAAGRRRIFRIGMWPACPNLMWSLYRYSCKLSGFAGNCLEPDGVMPPADAPALCSAFLELKVVKQGINRFRAILGETDDDWESIKRPAKGQVSNKLSPALLLNFLQYSFSTK